MRWRDDAITISELIGGAGTLEEGIRVIGDRLGAFELANVAYLQLPSSMNVADVRAATTYHPEWQKRYRELDYLAIDPVLSSSRTSLVPVDWCQLDRSAADVAALFAGAREYGVGRVGLSFPLHRPDGRFAVLSITSDVSEREWARRRRELTMCFLFAAAALEARAQKLPDQCESGVHSLLTPLESDCLRYLASGRTLDGLERSCRTSPTTIRASLETARRKLDVMTNAHAVARAVSLGYIAME